jgi:chemotaxis protein MotB
MMEKRDGNIVITIPDQVLFNSGEATVKPEALSFLQGLAQVMIELNRQVRVEGHTDNVPMRTPQFPSNWELSAARAVIVVRVFSELYGVPGHHLAALGYADSRPLTANLNPEQRAKNRRVEVIILEDSQSAPAVNMLSSQSERAASEEDNLPAVLQPPAPDKAMVPN